jgi:hypothetical protein
MLSCAATLLGQSFGDSIIEFAAVRKTVKFNKAREGQIPTTEVRLLWVTARITVVISI